jgi:phosphatidylglycerol---prolipoprotein diacylglyceryl transferase
MLPVITIGPLALPAPALLLLAGFWLGPEICEKQAPLFGVEAEKIYHLILAALIAGLVGARLAYAAQAPAAFGKNLLNLLSPRPELLDSTGGLALAVVAGLIFIRVKRMVLWPTLDALSGLLAVMGVTLGLAHLASGDAFGASTQVPWAIPLWGAERHPSQVYETLAALLIGMLTWPSGQIARASRQPGQEGFRLWSFLALSAAARIFLEAFRGDSILLAGSLRTAQIMAWIVLGISLWQIGRRIPKQNAIEQE